MKSSSARAAPITASEVARPLSLQVFLMAYVPSALGVAGALWYLLIGVHNSEKTLAVLETRTAAIQTVVDEIASDSKLLREEQLPKMQSTLERLNERLSARNGNRPAPAP